MNHVKEMSSEQLFTINNIIEKRVPESLQKYLSMNEEYRETLVNNEDKNALMLMNEVLSNYNQKLMAVIQEINENKLRELSVSQRYSMKM